MCKDNTLKYGGGPLWAGLSATAWQQVAAGAGWGTYLQLDLARALGAELVLEVFVLNVLRQVAHKQTHINNIYLL